MRQLEAVYYNRENIKCMHIYTHTRHFCKKKCCSLLRLITPPLHVRVQLIFLYEVIWNFPLCDICSTVVIVVVVGGSVKVFGPAKGRKRVFVCDT